MTIVHGQEMELSKDEAADYELFSSAKRFSKLSPDAIDRVVTSVNTVLARRYPDQMTRLWIDRHGVTHFSSQPR